MTLRSPGRVRVAIIGPRSLAVAAPHFKGNRAFPPGSGWEVRRICSVRFEPAIAMKPERPWLAFFSTGLMINNVDRKRASQQAGPSAKSLYSRLAVQRRLN